MVKGVAYITINTDASYKGGCGGYAFWIVSDEGKIQMAGELKGEVPNPTYAEMRCIINALHKLNQSSWLFVDKIHINTDSKTCIDTIERLKHKGKHDKAMVAYAVQAQTLMESIALKFGHTEGWRKVFKMVHVKAHTKNRKEKARTFINDWCDKKARYHARKAYDNKLVRCEQLNKESQLAGVRGGKDLAIRMQVLENKGVIFRMGPSDSPIRMIHTGLPIRKT